jgi:hypothetical protein
MTLVVKDGDARRAIVAALRPVLGVGDTAKG